jgi:hypothetical protein
MYENDNDRFGKYRQINWYRDGLRAGQPGSIAGRGKKFYLYSTAYTPALGSTQAFIKWVPGSILGGKRQEREADHSPPFSEEVKNGRAIPPFPHTSSWRVFSQVQG